MFLVGSAYFVAGSYPIDEVIEVSNNSIQQPSHISDALNELENTLIRRASNIPDDSDEEQTISLLNDINNINQV